MFEWIEEQFFVISDFFNNIRFRCFSSPTKLTKPALKITVEDPSTLDDNVGFLEGIHIRKD